MISDDKELEELVKGEDIVRHIKTEIIRSLKTEWYNLGCQQLYKVEQWWYKKRRKAEV